MGKKKSARHHCDGYRANSHVPGRDEFIIQQQFEGGVLIAAIVMAPFFGACMLMWAVVPC